MADIFPHPVDTFTDDQRARLGQVFEDAAGKEWMYVQFADAVAYVSGAVCGIENASTGIVTADESASKDRPGGVLVASARTATQKVPTENQYGFVQLSGYHPAVAKVAGVDSIAAGTGLVMHASSDGVANVDTGTPTTGELNRRIGFAHAASEDGASGTYNEDTVPAMLMIPRWASETASAV